MKGRIAMVLFTVSAAIVLCCVGLIIRGLNSAFAVMADSGFYRFENEHGLIHRYTRRETERLTRLGRGVVLYAQHHKGVLPAMDSARSVEDALCPAYVSKPETFTDPNSRRLFAVNAGLSNARLRLISTPADCVVFYQDAAPSRYPYVMYVTLDGVVHTEAVGRFSEKKSKAVA